MFKRLFKYLFDPRLELEAAAKTNEEIWHEAGEIADKIL